MDSCGACYFWREIKDAHNGRHGTCHAHAPRGWVPKGKDVYHPFAITLRTDFCGDYSPRNSKPIS